MIQQIQQLIDRIIGKKGILSVSSWWMNKILSDLITYCETQEESFKLSINDIRNKLENLINTATVEFENTDVLLEDCSKEIENLVERTEALEARNIFQICDVLPEESQENTIYLIPTLNEADGNVLTEWVFINGAWEQFGEFKADIDLSEYAKKTDIENYEYPTVTIDADTKTYSGQLGSKCINIDINISYIHYSTGTYDNKTLYLTDETDRGYHYSNDKVVIIFLKESNTIVDIHLYDPVFTYLTSELDYLDYKKCAPAHGTCRVYYSNNDTYYPAILDWDDYVTALIDGKYIKYKLNKETHLLELQSEIDISALETRLAALENQANS